jgi:hypothetical protein
MISLGGADRSGHLAVIGAALFSVGRNKARTVSPVPAPNDRDVEGGLRNG